MRQRAYCLAVRPTTAAPGLRALAVVQHSAGNAVDFGVQGSACAAQAAAGRMLYNTAEMDRGPLGEGDTVALLEGTQLCCTRQLRDLLHCLGGIPILLPLFAQLGTAPAPLCHSHLYTCGQPESAIERKSHVTVHAGVGES